MEFISLLVISYQLSVVSCQFFIRMLSAMFSQIFFMKFNGFFGWYLSNYKTYS